MKRKGLINKRLIFLITFEGIKMKKKIKMKLFGIFLVLVGSVIIIYSLFSSSGIWGMYIGMMMIISGLGFLGVNVRNYPF